jgi:hypothetical protein
MALPFNPFDKKAPQKKYTKVKVYENAPEEIEQKAAQKTSENHEKILGLSHDEHTVEIVTKQKSYENHAIIPDKIPRNSYDNHRNNSQWYNFSKLQQNILLYIYKNCVFNASLNTTPIRVSEMEEVLKTSASSIRKTIYNLIKNKTLQRESFKDGPGGWTKFLLTKETYDLVAIEAEKQKNHKIIIGKSYDNLVSSHEILDANSSSKYLNIKKELTNNFEIPENLKSIISQRELQKLLEKGLSEENIDLSLKHFAYDLANNLVKSKTGPLNLFFGVVRSGQVYKSIRLLEIENQELRNYQQELEKIEKENNQLKQNEMVIKYQEYIQKNPEYLEKIKSEHNNFSLNEEVLSKIAFHKFQDMKVD